MTRARLLREMTVAEFEEWVAYFSVLQAEREGAVTTGTVTAKE